MGNQMGKVLVLYDSASGISSPPKGGCKVSFVMSRLLSDCQAVFSVFSFLVHQGRLRAGLRAVLCRTLAALEHAAVVGPTPNVHDIIATPAPPGSLPTRLP